MFTSVGTFHIFSCSFWFVKYVGFITYYHFVQRSFAGVSFNFVPHLEHEIPSKPLYNYLGNTLINIANPLPLCMLVIRQKSVNSRV